MKDINVFNENLYLLEKLFPEEYNDSLEENKRKLFNETETSWENNIRRFTNNSINYLLLCEAPPDSGDYFYTNYKKPLFNKVWQTFFDIPQCDNDEDAYKSLADIGFLLLDSVPYSMDYSTGRKRYKPEYETLILNSLKWWQKKLNDNFVLSENTIIAFGFKLNAEKVIKVTDGVLQINNEPHILHKDNIVADRKQNWQPSIKNLKSVFNL
jgi:hypothetical protein